MESTTETTRQPTAAEAIVEALTATPVTVADLVESTGKSESSVKRALGKLIEGDEPQAIRIEGEGDEPDTYRIPKRERANYGYERNTSQGQNATRRSKNLRSVLEAAESAPNLQGLADLLSNLEGKKVTPRSVTHVIWRHRVERHEAGADVAWPFVRMEGKGAKATYVLDTDYEAANTRPDEEPDEGSESDAA